MLRQLSLVLLCCAGLTACGESGGSAGSDIKLVGEWAKIGETDNYLYYDDPASIKKTDDTVVTLDLFDYKSAQTEGGSTPTLSKATEREYDCQNKKSQPLKSNWYSGQMGGRNRRALRRHVEPMVRGHAGHSHRRALEGRLWQFLESRSIHDNRSGRASGGDSLPDKSTGISWPSDCVPYSSSTF